MGRPLLLIHGYSASGVDFKPLYGMLRKRGIDATALNVGNYVSLNNEITIPDIAEGLERAIRMTPALDAAEEFDAIVHSTGMLVVRSWLAHQSRAVGENPRLKRLKHLIGVAPATWGSPQAHKGRTWLGALVKGSKTPGPDFLNAGDEVLDGLELGSRFTWRLAHQDLLGPEPYFGRGQGTPYVAVFIGNTPYTGLSSVANDPGTDGTVRWSGCGLNTRKVVLDLTQTPTDEQGRPRERVTMSPWASDERLDIPMIAVEGRNHGTLISDPDEGMVDRIASFLEIADGDAYDKWLAEAKQWDQPAMAKMLVDPGKLAAGAVGEIKADVEHLLHVNGRPIEGWQQFVVRARDGHGEPVTDYMLEVFEKKDGEWTRCEEMSMDAHAYAADPSYRCIHVRLPEGISNGKTPLQIRIQASTGTNLMAYQGYGSDGRQEMRADADPVCFDITDGIGGGSLFYPFTTTLVEIVLNRVPYPFEKISDIFTFLMGFESADGDGAGAGS